MPTYDLHCTDCDSTFEVFRQGFLREQDRACACGGIAEQLITGFVTARPARPVSTQVRGYGGGHGGGCSCCSGGAGSRADWAGATGDA